MKHPRLFAALALTSIAWLAAAQHAAPAGTGIPIILSDSCAGRLSWHAPGPVKRVDIQRVDATKLSFTIESLEPNGTSSIGWEHDFESNESREFALTVCEQDLRTTQGSSR